MINKKSLSMMTGLAIFIGLILGSVITFIVLQNNPQSHQENSSQPLYWVAPMDPNYRRDEPGLSPMGMELVPVYGEAQASQQPGTISIDPKVVNNIGVRTAVVQRQRLQEEIHTVGYVQYDENKLIHIHPRVAGWVDKLYVKATGDPVQKGAPLYSLYSPELVNAQEELLLAINRNNSRLIKAAEDRLRALQIPIQFIEKIKRHKAVQSTITFYSPQDGVVDNLNIREGFYVQPGTTLFSIGALDQIWVEAEVFERQASLVKEGVAVTMSADYLPGRVWQGQVNYVYPTLDRATRTIRLRIIMDNADFQLLPNMFTQVVIHTQSDTPLLLIPREALIQTREQDRVVLALGEGRFKSIQVKVGRMDASHVEIIAGLEEGEQVVSSAQFLLDSESSKTSDFKRLDQSDPLPESVWVAGLVKAQSVSERRVTVTHEHIEAWDMMGMTMDFDVNPSVDISALRPGTAMHMHIRMGQQGRYEIIDTHIVSSPDNNEQASDTLTSPAMNHSEHSHAVDQSMDHSEHSHDSDQLMDHSERIRHQLQSTEHSEHSHDKHMHQSSEEPSL